MAKTEVRSTDNPKLLKKKMADGRQSLYLEYYFGYSKVFDEVKDRELIKKDRKREYLGLYLLNDPRTPIERQANKQTLELASEIRAEKEQELKKDKTGKRLFKAKGVNFLDYFQNYIDNYTKKDIRMLNGALQRFKDFLKAEYPIYQNSINPVQLSKDMITDFVAYLESKSKGEGARGYYQRFKKVIKFAIEHDVMIKNPCTGIMCKVDDQALRKDILSAEEMERLIATKYTGQNPEVRRAFAFCLYTGIRFCDVKGLKYSNVDFSNKRLKFEQVKTKGHSANSEVIIDLNEGHFTLIGEKPEKDDFIFNLPSHTMCLKALRHWTARAGIDKHITWHCARHTFAVSLLSSKNDIKTVASLLGHSGLRHTEKYTRAVDSLKKAAINSLPVLKF